MSIFTKPKIKENYELSTQAVALHFCKVYGYSKDGITFKNVNSILVMNKVIEWDTNTYVVLNKKLATKAKRGQDKWENIYLSKSILTNKDFVAVMDAKFKQKDESKIQPKKEEVATLLTPTKIGAHFEITAKEVNSILIELKFQSFTEGKGYLLLKKDSSTCMKNLMGVVNNAFETTSIRWNQNILLNPLLIKAVKALNKTEN